TSALLDLANRMQRYYTENNTYATATIANGTSTDVLASATSPQGYYTVSFVGTPTATTYTLRATRASTQTADTKCGDLTLDSTSVRGLYTGTYAAGITAKDCW